MTAVVFDGSKVASDSRLADDDGNITADSANNLFLIGRNAVAAGAGDYTLILLMTDFLKNTFKGKDVSLPLLNKTLKEFRVEYPEVSLTDDEGTLAEILVTLNTKHGLVAYSFEGIIPVKVVPPYGMGRGGTLAVAAMKGGADIFKAIHIAKELNSTVGGDVQYAEVTKAGKWKIHPFKPNK